MAEIYLVGGTTARTDLDNYVSANIFEDNAIMSMRRWQDYQGSYEDYHIDHIEIDDIAEHDSKLLEKVLDKIKDYSYEIETELPPYIDTVVELRDIDSIIAELKVEVKNK